MPVGAFKSLESHVMLTSFPFFYLPDSWFYLCLLPCQTSWYETLNHSVSVHLLTIFTGTFFNGIFLLGLALSVCLQSIECFIQPVDSPILVLIMACTSLGLNILSAFIVHGEFLLLLIKLPI